MYGALIYRGIKVAKKITPINKVNTMNGVRILQIGHSA